MNTSTVRFLRDLPKEIDRIRDEITQNAFKTARQAENAAQARRVNNIDLTIQRLQERKKKLLSKV